MVQISYQHNTVELLPHESVLDGLLRAGLPVSFSCRSGSCQACMLRIVAGEVPEESQRGLRPELKQLGYFLPCRCKPFSRLQIEPPDPKDVRLDALIAEKVHLGNDLCILRLELPPDVEVLPGQYIPVVHPDGETRSYSVANLPDEDFYFELHVARVMGGKMSNWMIDEVAVGDELKVLPPAGRFVYSDALENETLIMVANGTGLAPILPIVRKAVSRSGCGEIWLLHGARERSGLYADRWLRALHDRHRNFHYVGCCSRERVSEPFREGRVTDHLAQLSIDPDRCRIFAAGHPEMIEDVRRICADRGIDTDCRMVSDAFEFDFIRTTRPNPSAVADADVRKVPPPDPELWKYLGNGKLLREVLADFYALAFEDEYLGPYFVGVTQKRLREKQYSFLKSLVLGTRDYFGQRPRNAHHWMVISDWLFDYRLQLMTSCLRDHGVGKSWIRRWHVFEEFFRADIVKDKPIARTVNGQSLSLIGIEESILDEGSLCDRCGGEIAAGEPATFHLELGKVYCRHCAVGSSQRENKSSVA